jgi:CRP-like cAMP-binding protein
MPPITVNPDVVLADRPGDELLTPAQLEQISLFAQLKTRPSLQRFPGAVVLRRYRQGEVIVRQGEAGATAFYILTSEDLLQLRRSQLEAVRQRAEQPQEGTSSAWRARLGQRLEYLEQEVRNGLRRVESLAGGTDPRSPERQAATAHLLVDLSRGTPRGVLHRLRSLFARPAAPAARPASVPNDGPADIPLDTRRSPMFEGELFGEMSCMSRAPRSATVIADRDCYLLEMLRNILDMVRKDEGYKERTDQVYRTRALDDHLRKLAVFSSLDDGQFERLRRQVELATFEPGQVVFHQGDAADCLYVIRSGLVQVVKDRGQPGQRTLAYIGRGDFFGEAGILFGEPRNATCIAYDHPDAGQSSPSGKGITPSRLELVRIGREALLEAYQSAPALKAQLDAEAQARRKHHLQAAARPAWEERPALLHPRADELGLVQGQQLMLIDLDRCTRCGDCVRACIATHDDGASRLYLDGPRFGKHLVPNTCRQCRDPVCMIGCPVGSIQRGERGQIVIKEWCIGCGLCADQCPYGAIHMHALSNLRLLGDASSRRTLTPSDVEVEVREIESRAVVCDLCSELSLGQPACVYHCPHEAAIRTDAQYELP